MTRELVIRSWCDGLCADRPEPMVATVEQRVDVDGKLVVIDLCEPCYSILVGPLEEHARKFGRPPEVAEVRRRPVGGGGSTTCPACGFQAASGQGLNVHITRMHTNNPKEQLKDCLYCEYRGSGAGMFMHVAANHPDKPPYVGPRSGPSHRQPSGALRRNVDGDIECPDCDYTTASAAGMGSHRSASHGYVAPKKSL